MDPTSVGNLILFALMGGVFDWIGSSQLRHNQRDRNLYEQMGLSLHEESKQHDPITRFLMGDALWHGVRIIGLAVLAFAGIDAIALLLHHPLL